MSSPCATVNKILPFSCVDGPGNRLVIFLQGCNFRCVNCHNPYTIGNCDHCGDCVVKCPHDSLSLVNNKVVWASNTCQQCDTCLDTCTRSASPMTTNYSVDQMLALIRQYAPFLNGITLSGGEATLQLPFIRELFYQVKNSSDLNHLTCLVDSNGYLAQIGWQRILPLMDGAMIDLKAWDSRVHHRLTGRDNQRVLDSLTLLARENKLYEVRLLVIPEQTDLCQRVDELAQFLHQLGSDLRVRINAFQHHGVKGEAKTWQVAVKTDIEEFANALQDRGINNIVKPSVYLN